jgi:hypothetical protein
MDVNTDGREVVVCQSVEHPGCPPQTNYVRGYIRYGNAVSMELASVVMGGSWILLIGLVLHDHVKLCIYRQARGIFGGTVGCGHVPSKRNLRGVRVADMNA